MSRETKLHCGKIPRRFNTQHSALKTFRFLMFSGGVEMENWVKIG